MRLAEYAVVHGKPYESILDLIGNTPILHLNNLKRPGEGDVYAKIEFMNPGGSVKDRAALGLILDAEKKGLLSKGSTIIEPTAGNTGIGLALIGVLRGYRVIIVMPEKFSKEKRILCQALGAELVLTPTEEAMEGAISKAKELAVQIPNSYVPQQFENPANPSIHYHTTGREIFEQMGGNVDAVVIGAGTGGTLTGVGRYMKERVRDVIVYLVEPEGSIFGGGKPGPHRVEGIGSEFIPGTLDMNLVDHVITVTDIDAFDMVRQLAQKEGLLVGSSSGANVWAALKVAGELRKGKIVVTVLPDGSERYMSKDIFDLEK
ncbi:MAG: cysteine synthase A [Acidobacteriota bacterium]